MNRATKLIVVVFIVLLALALIVLDALPNPPRHKPPAITSVSPRRGASTGPYTVEMSPMGKVTFKHVPARILTADPNYDTCLSQSAISAV